MNHNPAVYLFLIRVNTSTYSHLTICCTQMADKVFAKYSGELKVESTGISSRGKEVLVMSASDMTVLWGAGVSADGSTGWVHSGLILSGPTFYLSWTGDTYNCLLFHRTDHGITISGIDRPGDAREVLNGYTHDDTTSFQCYSLGKVECSTDNVSFLSSFVACMRSDLGKPTCYKARRVKPGDTNCTIFVMSAAISLGIPSCNVVNLALKIAQRPDILSAVGVSGKDIVGIVRCVLQSLPGLGGNNGSAQARRGGGAAAGGSAGRGSGGRGGGGRGEVTVGGRGRGHGDGSGGVSVGFPCRFGFKCHASGCTYGHPDGRMVDTPCNHDLRCNNEGCGYWHSGTPYAQLALKALRKLSL